MGAKFPEHRRAGKTFKEKTWNDPHYSALFPHYLVFFRTIPHDFRTIPQYFRTIPHDFFTVEQHVHIILH